MNINIKLGKYTVLKSLMFDAFDISNAFYTADIFDTFVFCYFSHIWSGWSTCSMKIMFGFLRAASLTISSNGGGTIGSSTELMNTVGTFIWCINAIIFTITAWWCWWHINIYDLLEGGGESFQMMNTVGTFKMTMMILVSKMMILQKYLDIVEMVLTAHRIVEI